jgi:hypothetical protein
MTPPQETLDRIARAACELLLEARMSDFLGFLTPRRIAQASTAEDFALEPFSESTVRHHFRKEGNSRAFDLDALISTLLRQVSLAFDVSPFDEEAKALTTIGEILEYQLMRPLRGELDHGTGALFFVCFGAMSSDHDAQTVAVGAVNSLIGDVEGYLRSATAPPVDDLEWLTMTLVYSGLGNILLARRLADDPARMELQGLITRWLVGALVRPSIAMQTAKKPTYSVVEQQLGPHRKDATDVFGAIITASSAVIERATLDDYLSFLSSASIARRAAVDRKTVVGHLADPAQPNRFNLERLLNIIDHVGISLQGAGVEAGPEIFWRLDSLGAACRAERWLNGAQMFHDRAVHEHHVRSLGRRADDTLIGVIQQAEPMLVSGYRTLRRVAGREFERETQEELIHLIMMLFSAQEG